MSFKENFTREEKDNLEFDYSAFWTYATTFIIVFLIPTLYKIKNRLFYKNELLKYNKKNSKLKNCQCENCQKKLIKYCYKKRKQNYDFSFYLLIVFALLLSISLYFTYHEVINNEGKFKTFNPFEILEIEESAEKKQIKKAFKRLSVIYHPDRNDSPEARARFIMITKAYEALTDPIAIENYKKYGNPDGHGSMRLSIALPPFVYDKRNHMPILVLFLTFLMVILPGAIYLWFKSTQEYDDSGVRLDNQKILYEYLNENVLLRQLPFIVGTATEFSNLKLKKEQASILDQLYKKYKEKFPKHKDISFENKKAICIIYSSLEDNKKTTDECLKEDVDYVMSKIPDLTLNMYKLAIDWTFMYYQYAQMGSSFIARTRIKNFGINCLKNIIEFSQNIHQQLGPNSVPYNQLPHIDSDKYREMQK